MKLLSIISELHNKYEYGSVMLCFDFPQLKIIHNLIKPEDIYNDPTLDAGGLEKESHVTLLYGLHNNVSDEQVKGVIEKIIFGPCKITNLSLFRTNEYDILKYDVNGNGIYESNTELKKFPHTTDFPDYHPHLTVAYLKPNTGKKYSKSLSSGQSYTLIPKYAVYSKTNGTKEKLDINVKK